LPEALPGVGAIPDLARPAKPPSQPSAELFGPLLDPVTEAALKRLESTDTARIAALSAELERLIAIGGDTSTGKQGEALRAVRLEVVNSCPAELSEFLLEQFALPAAALIASSMATTSAPVAAATVAAPATTTIQRAHPVGRGCC
jgi:hypothetical protein